MATVILEVDAIHTHIGAHAVVRGLSFEIAAGEVVALLGRNGSGKTTTINSIVGLAPPRSGAVRLRGADITGWRPHKIARSGVALVAQGRRVFRSLTVEENLRVCKGVSSSAASRVLGVFPELAARLTQRSGKLSGGEQQMLSIARALAFDPAVLILDEPSDGLAEPVIRRITELILRAREGGAAVLISEQDVSLALAVADRVLVLERGQIAFRGVPLELRRSAHVLQRYLGRLR